MPDFDPPSLERRLEEADQKLRDAWDWPLIGESWDSGFLLWEDLGEECVTEETVCPLTPPRADDGLRIAVGSIPAFVDELLACEFIEHREVLSPTRYQLRTELVVWGHPYPVFPDIPSDEQQASPFASTLTTSDGELHCQLRASPSFFSFAAFKHGYHDKYLPLVLSGEYFVEVTRPKGVRLEACRSAAHAFLFELSSIGLDFEPMSRPTGDELVFQEETLAGEIAPRLRPLLGGPGLDELFAAYLSAATAPSPEYQILGFAKCLEYVSETVIQQRLIRSIRAKLSGPRALQPDSEFALELKQIVSDESTYRRERQAMELTVLECCEATELARVAPPVLRDLARCGRDSDAKARSKALKGFANSLSATRNSIAHAKATYDPTGEEIPSDEWPELAKCARAAAQQAIRWYGALSPQDRVRGSA